MPLIGALRKRGPPIIAHDVQHLPAQHEPEQHSGGTPSWLRDLLEVIAIALVLYLVIWFCIQTVKVEGTSMINTLQDGDLLIASKISYTFGAPERGDIVILQPPPYCDTDPQNPLCATGNALQSHDYIKRVIGIPGDKLEIDGNMNPTAIYIQPGGADPGGASAPWTRVAEPYLPETWTHANMCCTSTGLESNLPQQFTVPPGQYFVLGDNRNNSNDSRFLGLIPRNKIAAKAILRIWPWEHFGGLGPEPTLVTLPALPALALVNRKRWRRNRALLRATAAALPV